MLSRISNVARDYAWGSTSLIPELQGRTPGTTPEAEVWFGDHPGSPAVVEDGTGRTLGEWLGEHESAQWRPLPYLLKLLAAAEPLSIQAHPSKEQAVAGFAHENELGIALSDASRNYKDDNHKPELIVAISEQFRALAGFRELAATRELVQLLGDGPGVTQLRGFLDEPDAAAGVRAAMRWVLSEEATDAVREIIEALRGAASDTYAAELETLQHIAEARPGDPGVVVALLMNVVTLQRGEAVYVRAGVIHAYLDGLGVEIMAASDNVMRGGLTPKWIDVDELLAVLDTTPGPAPILPAQRDAHGTERFLPDVPDFQLGRVLAHAGAPSRAEIHGPSIVLSVAGSVTVRGEVASEPITLTAGEALIVSSDERALTFDGEGEVFLAEPGNA